jgi:zinc/manganese transport system substrate-binding protein
MGARRHAIIATRRELLAAALALSGTCAFRVPWARADSTLRVVASFSILADFVANVGADRVEIETLVGPDSDAHVYTPSPADAQRVRGANVVFVNGLGFEGWMPRLIKASGGAAAIAVATQGIKPRRMPDADDHGRIDPHAWQSVANAKIYVGNIRDALIAAEPSGSAVYRAAADGYLTKLAALDEEVREAVERVPPERRKVITTHDAFGYFADAYGIAFIAPQGVSTEAQPSAREVARIIDQIRRQRIPALFLENISDPRLLQRIAAETGAKIGGTLYSDALTGPAGEAPTYIAMMRHNIRVLSQALMS